MPYINQESRERIDRYIHQLEHQINNVGELNYVFSRLADYFAAAEGGNYAAYNAVMGVFESAKAEFYRRRVSPYEDEKIISNGDIYINETL